MQQKITYLFLAVFIFISTSCSLHPLKSSKHNNKKEQVKKEEEKKTKGKFEDYNRFIEDTTRVSCGIFSVYQVKNDYFFEIPFDYEKREFLVVNKLSKVSGELNDAGLNKGINYENRVIQFEIDTIIGKVFIREVNPYIESKVNDAITQSVEDNFSPSISEYFDIKSFNKDSSGVIIKVNKIYDGSENSINDVFNSIGIGGSVNKNLSRILQVKVFPENLLVRSEYSTKVTEGKSSVNVSVVVSSNLLLLPQQPMQPRFADARVGYFSNKRWYFNDKQQRMEKKQLVHRWRLEPKATDIEKYKKGVLVEPNKPIIFYIDESTPKQWKPYIKQGIEDWQVAFEQAGFKNAIRVEEVPKDKTFDPDDVRFSVITYAASPKANAMGPSVVDPRSGEILEADVIWWHNVMTALHRWIRVQTGIINPDVRQNELPEKEMGRGIRFVAAHEIGHTLGLTHNMGASFAYPVDSLRSKTFTDKMGTSPSIMDYARFNYVAQPGDGVTNVISSIGIYDIYAINWAYRWIDSNSAWSEMPTLNAWINKHVGDELYRYGEQQDGRMAIDPRAQSEDIGNDAVKASTYGIDNLKKIVPQIEKWTEKEGEDYTESGKLLTDVMNQWYTYAYHVLNYVGGIYVNKTVHGDNQDTYMFVEKEKQKNAMQFLVNEVFNTPDWLFKSTLLNKTLPVKSKPGGNFENTPLAMLRGYMSYIYWDLLRPERMIRMLENESIHENKAYTAVEMLSDLHKGVFASTIKGEKLTIHERENQKILVDALIIAADKFAMAKNYKKLQSPDFMNHKFCSHANCLHSSSYGIMKKEINFDGMKRVSDAVSAKRGELLRIKKLLSRRLNIKDDATKFHYQDLIIRIDQALGL